MVKITIRIEQAGDNYILWSAKFFQVPRIGELVDLASIAGLDVRGKTGYAVVENVLHPFSKRGRAKNPVIVFKASNIPFEILDKISYCWVRHEVTSCKRNY